MPNGLLAVLHFHSFCPIMLRCWHKRGGCQPAQQYPTFAESYGGQALASRLPTEAFGEGGMLALRLQRIGRFPKGSASFMVIADANERTVMRLSTRLAAIALAL